MTEKTAADSVEKMKKSSHRDCAEEIKTSSVKRKVGKKRRRDECGVEGSAVTSETLAEKKRVKKRSSSSHVAESGKQELSNEEVERQLLKISATPHTRLLVSPDSEQLWFDQVRSSLIPHYYYNLILGSTVQSVSAEAAYLVSEATLAHLSSVAQEIMKTEIQLFEKGKDSMSPLGLLYPMFVPYFLLWCSVREKRKGASEVKWLKSVLTSGTLSDKVAAHTLLVQVSVTLGLCAVPLPTPNHSPTPPLATPLTPLQESPVHSLSSLDWLLGLVAKGGSSSMKGVHAKRKGILAISKLFNSVCLCVPLQLLSLPSFSPLHHFSLPLSLSIFSYLQTL